MTDFAVTGKKRSGKGLFCAGMIRDALRQGRRVATNMDIFPERFLSPWDKSIILRIPDSPVVADMEQIGKGYEGDEIEEEKNGLIVLDECSRFFNSRAWSDKSRQPLLDWLVHSGKLRWDVYYQMQGLEQVDKQIRSTQVEYHIPVKRTDKWPIPIITPLFGLFGIKVTFPKLHLGIIKHGCDRDALVVGRKWYKAKELYAAYDTEQKFLDREHPEAVGIHSILSAWHVKGRYLPKPPSAIIRFWYGVIGKDWTKIPVPEVAQKKPKHYLVVLLSKLPEPERLYHWHKLNQLGAFADKFAKLP